MEAAENRRRDHAITVRKPMSRKDRCHRSALGDARPEARVRAPVIVQPDNATLIVPSLEKFVIGGIHGSVGLSPCTRH